MHIKTTLPIIICFLTTGLLPGQVPQDVTVPLTAVVNLNPASVSLSWPNPVASNLLILRRTKGQGGDSWVALLVANSTTQNSFVDQNVVAGQTYEYAIQRVKNVYAYGYAQVALAPPIVDNRGKLLLFVDSDISAPLSTELDRLRADLAGDGWHVIEHAVGAGATVQSIKNQIVADYNADPANVKSVFLLGKIPVPYSGNTNWDGHPDHQGAWPSDAYYADINGNWTDVSVNNTSPSRAANINIPGDGKFDQSTIPSPVELQVGRVDFRRLSTATFGTTTVELLRRYLDKDHNWRTGAYTAENKALVDDNFGYFNGEAFAENGYRNAYPLVGESNVMAGDFFNSTVSQHFLLGYGCGGGWYSGAGGVGASGDFANDTVNIVFSNLFGSYHGDWDYETDPFMPAALASRGGILTCSWAGRPHHFYQALASGETIGYCMVETQNAQYNSSYFASFGESGAHVALLGDPSLRAQIVAPPQGVTASTNCGTIQLKWSASADASVTGYFVYRSQERYGAYTRLNVNPVTNTSFVDNDPVEDTLYYQVRAVKLQTSPGGGIYTNTSTGGMASFIYTAPGVPPPPGVSVSNEITCNQPSAVITVMPAPGTICTFFNPDDPLHPSCSTTVQFPGAYTVIAADPVTGCTSTAVAMVVSNTAAPTAFGNGGVLTCTDPTLPLSVSWAPTPGVPSATFSWTGPCLSQGYIACQPGVYTLTATNPDNGCVTVDTALVLLNNQPPDFDLPDHLSFNCITVCAQLLLPDTSGIEFQLDNQSLPANEPVNFCNAGNYILTATSLVNGCSVDYPVEVVGDLIEPGASANVSGVISCANPAVLLTGTSLLPNAGYKWTGPNGFMSTNQNTMVSLPGTYILTVTNPVSGCTSVATVQVGEDGSLPNISASGGVLTCAVTSVQLDGGSATPNVIFAWTGPDGFISSDEDPVVSVPGAYTFMVTSQNGCAAQLQVSVLQDTAAPVVTIEPYGQLNCNEPCITVLFTQSMPFSSVDSMVICQPGNYTYTATSSQNGCITVKNFTVAEVPPVSLSAIVTDVSESGASNGSIVLQVTNGTSPYTYLWSNGTTGSTLENITAGTYSVTVTDAGGCTLSESFEVLITLGANEPSLLAHLSLTPNPTVDNAILDLKLKKPASLRIEIRNATGVRVWEQAPVSVTESKIPLRLANYPPGVYTVYVWIDNEVVIRKLAVVR